MRSSCRTVRHSCSRCALAPGTQSGRVGLWDLPVVQHTQLSHRRESGGCPDPSRTALSPAQPYLTLELHEVLRHAAQGKDLTILSWGDKHHAAHQWQWGNLMGPVKQLGIPRSSTDPSPTSPRLNDPGLAQLH